MPILSIARQRCTRLAILATLALLVPASASAQVASGTAKAPAPLQQLNLAAGSVQTLSVPAGLPSEFALPLEIDGRTCAMILEQYSLRSPAFRLLAQGADGQIVVREPLPCRTYRGRIVFPGRPEHEDGTIAATLRDGTLSAVCRLRDGSLHGVQPLRAVDSAAPSARHMVYRLRDVAADGSVCGVGTSPKTGEAGGRGGSMYASTQLITEIAIDADREFFAQCGASVVNTLTDIESVLNGVEVIYESQVGTTIQVNTVLVRTAEPDPYSTTDPLQLLKQFQSEWTGPQVGVKRDVTHLFTGKDLDGATIGFANGGVVCSIASGYGLSQSHYTTNLASRVALTAHELGHNFGAQHCSGTDCHIMCPAIGGCGGGLTLFGAAAWKQIHDFIKTATCLTPTLAPLSLPFQELFPLPQVENALWESAVGVEVVSGGNEPSSPFSLCLDATGPGIAQQDEIVSTQVALSAQHGAIVSFQVRPGGVEKNECLIVEYFALSQTWTELTRIVSSGKSSAQFSPVSVVVPLDAEHDGFRVRFRTDVDETNDDWFIDDVRIDPAPLGPPTIHTLSPTDVQALDGGTVTLQGSGYSADGLSITIGSVPLASFTLIDDSTIQFASPEAPALGQTDVIVSTVHGTSAPAKLTYQPVDPPKLLAPLIVLNGTNLTLHWGADPGDVLFFLYNLSGQTTPFMSHTLLQTTVLVPYGNLNSVGTGTLTIPFSGVPMGTVLYMQIVCVDPPGFDASTAKVSDIAATVAF